MTNLDIRAIAAVGRSGQIGLNGKLPWKNSEDMAFFKNQIQGGIVIVGRKTYDSMPLLHNCLVDVWSRRDYEYAGNLDPEVCIRQLADRYRHWPTPPTLWIAGGREIYKLWAPFVKRLVISTIDYDGPSDTLFPWQAYQKHLAVVRTVESTPFSFDEE